MTIRPPGFSTRHASRRPPSRFSKLRTPKATVTRSKLLSSKGSDSALACTSSTFFCTPSSAILSRPWMSISSDRSTPTTVPLLRIRREMAMARSPVPVARSSTFSASRRLATRRTALRRHRRSSSNDIRWFIRSYFGAMVLKSSVTVSLVGMGGKDIRMLV